VMPTFDITVHYRLKLRMVLGLLYIPPHICNVVAMHGTVMKPYICADSAFALSPSVMKCYETLNSGRTQFKINYALIR